MVLTWFLVVAFFFGCYCGLSGDLPSYSISHTQAYWQIICITFLLLLPALNLVGLPRSHPNFTTTNLSKCNLDWLLGLWFFFEGWFFGLLQIMWWTLWQLTMWVVRLMLPLILLLLLLLLLLLSSSFPSLFLIVVLLFSLTVQKWVSVCCVVWFILSHFCSNEQWPWMKLTNNNNNNLYSYQSPSSARWVIMNEIWIYSYIPSTCMFVGRGVCMYRKIISFFLSLQCSMQLLFELLQARRASGKGNMEGRCDSGHHMWEVHVAGWGALPGPIKHLKELAIHLVNWRKLITYIYIYIYIY